MISEPFATGTSFIHKLDPRVRVIFATAYCVVVALAEEFPVLLVALALSVALVLLSGLNLRAVAKRMLIVNSLVFLLWAILPLTFGGAALLKVGPFSIYRQGLLLAAQITLKSNAILLAFIALAATMTFSTLGYALDRLHIPQKMINLLLMTYRYLFVIEQEYQRLLRATKIRGFIPKTNLHTYRTYAYVIGMLFVRAAARADRVYQAMLCRGFKGHFYCLQEFRIDGRGWIFSLAMTVIIIGLIVLDYYAFKNIPD
jgi:cobalt/nickel transport system permease protein